MVCSLLGTILLYRKQEMFLWWGNLHHNRPSSEQDGMKCSICTAERKAKQGRPCGSGRAVTWVLRLLFHSLFAGGTGAEQNCSCAAQESATGGRSRTSEHRDPKKQQMEKDTSIKRTQIIHEELQKHCAVQYCTTFTQEEENSDFPLLVQFIWAETTSPPQHTAHQVSDSSKNIEQSSPANTQENPAVQPLWGWEQKLQTRSLCL